MRLLSTTMFGITKSRPLPGTDGTPMPFVLVGDEAFQMWQNLMRPYLRFIQYATGRYFECEFGTLTGK